jgi:hypothetical protein
MRKIGFVLALIVLLMGVSVQAQKRNKGIQPITPPVKSVVSVQDQDGEGFLSFDLVTGAFTCQMCEYKYTYTGVGQVKIDGFNVYLTAISDSYQIFVTVDVWTREGKAVMEMFKAPDEKFEIVPFKEFFTDLNIDNNSLSCFKLQPAQ